MEGQGQPPKTTIVLDEHELMEIMVDLVEMTKSCTCTDDRAKRIQKLLDDKIDPAMKRLRVGYTIEDPLK